MNDLMEEELSPKLIGVDAENGNNIVSDEKPWYEKQGKPRENVKIAPKFFNTLEFLKGWHNQKQGQMVETCILNMYRKTAKDMRDEGYNVRLLRDGTVEYELKK